MSKVYFVADLHISHKNILRYQPNRIDRLGLKDEEDIETHDERIIEMWHNTIKRNDEVYVLGDFIMTSGDASLTWKILCNLKSNGCKIHLIVGNHDRSILKYEEMFESIETIKEVSFSTEAYPFLKDRFKLVLCHFPLISWNCKSYGVAHLHGHTHSNSPWENEGPDLRLNVGFDTRFNECGFISLEEVYDWYLKKTGGMNPTEYINKCKENDSHFIR